MGDLGPDDRDRSQAEINNEYRQIITRLIHGEPRTGPSTNDQVPALFAKLSTDRPVGVWVLMWEFDLDDDQVDLLAGFIQDGFRFKCGVHESHDFGVSITRRYLTVKDREEYGEAEVQLLAAALEELVGGTVHVLPHGLPDGGDRG